MFEDTYISEKDNTVKPDVSKTVLSNDAFAIGQQINILVNKIIEVLRVLK